MKQTTYGADKNILIAPELSFRVGVQVGDTGVTADANGKKIVKAGTPLYAEKDVLVDRTTIMSSVAGTPSEDDETTSVVQGILMHDTDVTSGAANATMIVTGQIDLLKLDETVKISDAVKQALPQIQFMNGRAK